MTKSDNASIDEPIQTHVRFTITTPTGTQSVKGWHDAAMSLERMTTADYDYIAVMLDNVASGRHIVGYLRQHNGIELEIAAYTD